MDKSLDKEALKAKEIQIQKDSDSLEISDFEKPLFTEDNDIKWYERLLASIVMQGETPQHIAFIMDGNRRFAKRTHSRITDGHKAGHTNLIKTLSRCVELSFSEVTVYAFSIENYKRSDEEVGALITMFHNVFSRILYQIDDTIKKGICIQVFGDWNFMPESLKPLMAKVMVETRHCNRFRVNVAICYTGQNEILNGVRKLEKGVRDGELHLKDITEGLLEQSFYLIPSKPLDILLRTSGETRISDFMNWQSAYASLEFVNCLWPELKYMDLIKAIMNFQTLQQQLRELGLSDRRKAFENISEKGQNFLQKIRQEQWDILEKEALAAPAFKKESSTELGRQFDMI